MLLLTLCALLAGTPPAPVTLKAGAAEPGEPVNLHLVGLSAPEHPQAGLYLYGSLSASPGSIRALLLRSTDGGVRWTEVLPTVERSEVLFLQFHGCQGRALVGWTMEGPGELVLLASTDCGATWKRRSTLPKAVWSEWPEQMAWTDGQRGTVWVRDANEENPPLRALATADGGKTWRPVESPPPTPPPSTNEREARGASGVLWKLTSDERTARVERQDASAPAQVRAVFPLSWKREGKKLVPVP